MIYQISDRQELVDAAETLRKSPRGRMALSALQRAFPGLHSLDSRNRVAVMVILHGFFGEFPSTAEEVVREECELCGQSIAAWTDKLPGAEISTSPEA